jgi:hypothetical protein
MKSLLILILLAVSCGGAFLSRPSEQSFRDMVHKKMDTGEGKDGLVQAILRGGKSRGDAYLEGCKYQDRLLWATVERDGKKVYTGAFSTWFETEAGGVPKMEKKG